MKTIRTERAYITRLAVILAIILILAVPASADTKRDTLYQVSTIDALMAGLYDGSVSIGQLAKHGDIGLGTFDKLDGEMIVVDGKVYRITADGLAHLPDKSVTTPFAAVTFFDRDVTVRIGNEMNLAALKEYLDGLIPSKNLFYAIRIDGTFSYVKTRSVPSQKKPYPPLVDAVAHQTVSEFTNVEGTIVAVRCPYFVKGVNVTDYHLHFITADRKRGGHLLDCTIKSGDLALDTTPEFDLFLPNDDGFYRMNFEADNQSDLQKVEQAK